MDEKFSVLMTTYHGEKPEFLALSLNSVLVEQTRLPDQFVLLVDGPIPEELDEVIKRYANDFPEIMQVIYSPVNQGQSKASAEGLKYVKYDLVARMDSDDICRPYRFEKELEVFSRDPNIGVVGGWISRDGRTDHARIQKAHADQQYDRDDEKIADRACRRIRA